MPVSLFSADFQAVYDRAKARLISRVVRSPRRPTGATSGSISSWSTGSITSEPIPARRTRFLADPQRPGSCGRGKHLGRRWPIARRDR